MGLHEVSIGSVSKSQQWLSTAARDSSASPQNRFGFTLWYESTNFNDCFLFSFSSFIWNHFENIIDVAEVYQRHFLEESEHWLENINRTHLVLANGMLALPKRFSLNIFPSLWSLPDPELLIPDLLHFDLINFLTRVSRLTTAASTDKQVPRVWAFV